MSRCLSSDKRRFKMIVNNDISNAEKKPAKKDEAG
jgi:hypothetical protein